MLKIAPTATKGQWCVFQFFRHGHRPHHLSVIATVATIIAIRPRIFALRIAGNAGDNSRPRLRRFRLFGPDEQMFGAK